MHTEKHKYPLFLNNDTLLSVSDSKELTTTYKNISCLSPSDWRFPVIVPSHLRTSKLLTVLREIDRPLLATENVY